MRDFGINKTRQIIQKDIIIENILEFKKNVNGKDFNRKNFIKYYKNKNSVSPESAISCYKWKELIKHNNLNLLVNKENEDFLLNLGQEYIQKCKLENVHYSYNNFKSFVYSLHPNLSVFSIVHKKSGWNNFLKKLGVKPISKVKIYSDDELLDKIYQAYIDNNNSQPTYKNITSLGLSMATINNRFGSFYVGLEKMYSKYNIKKEIVKSIKPKQNRKDVIGESIKNLEIIKLVEGPVNEQGVVGIFFKIHLIIGFSQIIKGQVTFPDCYAISIRDNVEKRVWIEFKYKSSQWKQSRKSPDVWNNMVNYLICWIHDSKDFEINCTRVEVIELRKIILDDSFPELARNIYSIDK